MRPEDADETIVEALDAVATGSTARAGRLLAPFAVRYIIVPVVDGATSLQDDPLPLPTGLLDALGDQLDLGEVYSPRSNYIVFENQAWIPARSMLTADGAEASRRAGAVALAQADASGATPILIGVRRAARRAGTTSPPGRSTSPSRSTAAGRSRWTVSRCRVGRRSARPSPSTSTVPAAPGSRTRARRRGSWFLAAQAIGWVVVLLAAINVRVPRMRRAAARRRARTEPLIALARRRPSRRPLEPLASPEPADRLAVPGDREVAVDADDLTSESAADTAWSDETVAIERSDELDEIPALLSWDGTAPPAGPAESRRRIRRREEKAP